METIYHTLNIDTFQSVCSRAAAASGRRAFYSRSPGPGVPARVVSYFRILCARVYRNCTGHVDSSWKLQGLVQPFNEFEPSAVSLNLNSDFALCIVMETEYYSFSAAGKLTCSALLFWIFGNVCCVKKSSRGSDSSLQVSSQDAYS